MATIKQLRRCGKELLLRAIYQSEDQSGELAAIDADALLGYVLSCDKTKLLVDSAEEVTFELESNYLALLLRRASYEPVAYILGKKEFFGLEFSVSPAVLIPRPETELLVERVVDFARRLLTNNLEKIRLIDIGTGSGAIILAVLNTLQEQGVLQRVEAIGTDISREAIEIAKRNALQLGLAGNVTFYTGDLLLPVPARVSGEQTAEIIISNPPYIAPDAELPPDVIKYEPKGALFGPDEGLGIYARLIPAALSRISSSQGGIFLEIGYDQAGAVVSMLPDGHYVNIYKDLAGKERVVAMEQTAPCP